MNSLLYVRNLSYEVTQDQLRELFSRAGEVFYICLITDRWTGVSKGFGFVQMATEAASQKAVQLLHGLFWAEQSLLVHITVNSDRP
ncbi:MAG: RNA-binding protein [Chloroflexi bacterium]|nr:RNA-binding protein [Chloroflexota bacterium]